jgi:transcriptional regulator with XRE-family HTH domain
MTTIEIPPAKQKGDLLSAIGDTLRTERTEKGLTLKQVAEGAHVSVSYLAEIERGEKDPSSRVLDPSSRVLESIARGLDVELHELLIRIATALEPAPVVPVSNSLAA